jgi:Integrase core domain
VLAESNVAAKIPAQELRRARSFYADKLGSSPSRSAPGGLRYRCGHGEFALFESAGAAAGDHTQMAWEVDDLEETIAEPRQRGVIFEEYDSKFTTAFDGVFSGNGTRVIKTPVRSPRANSFAERFVGTLRRECLDHVLILGERHLRKILAEYTRHYNGHRPHQGLQQKLPLRQPGHPVDISVRIERRQILGGLISEYRRAA